VEIRLYTILVYLIFVRVSCLVGGVIAGYPLATFGKLYGWDQTFLLFQIMAAVNFVVHFYTRNINKCMVNLNKIQ
jgi:sugar phosphate permease